MKTPQIDPGLDALIKAREYLSDPDHWCQGSFESGEKRCIMGMLLDQAEGFSRTTLHLDRIARMPIEDFNDTHTHAEVLALLDEAIATYEVAGR